MLLNLPAHLPAAIGGVVLPVGIALGGVLDPGILWPPVGKFLALRNTPFTALISCFRTSIWSFFPSAAERMPKLAPYAPFMLL
jgi:hypothetical protein